MATLSSLEKDFKNLVKNEVLSHAYALHGQNVATQFSFAKALANFLEHAKFEQPTTVLLDAKFIDGTQQNLGVDVAREFSDFLYRQPVASIRRTLVINNAEEFTTQAQNAILKMVEEPPSHGLIILTIRDVNSLLPALRSRLQKIYVSSAEKATSSEIEGRAQELVEKFFKMPAAERSKFIKSLVDEDKEAEKNQQIVEHFVRGLIVELAKNPQQNVRALKELLKRQSAMADFTTSKRLQIEAALQFLR